MRQFLCQHEQNKWNLISKQGQKKVTRKRKPHKLNYRVQNDSGGKAAGKGRHTLDGRDLGN